MLAGIIFGDTNECMCKNFFDLMQFDFEMNMIGELKFFLGLQVKQNKGIHIRQQKYTKELLKKFKMEDAKPIIHLCIRLSICQKMNKIHGIITHKDKVVNKLKKDYTQDDYDTLQLNVKARYSIACALSKYEYNTFCSYKITKDMCDAIQITYEGTKDVQFRKTTTFMRHYKMFIMKEDGTIDEMFGRFQTILNGLSSLGHEFSKSHNNLKIHDSLPKAKEVNHTNSWNVDAHDT
ncbi:hypothetical protein CR513_48291, partial [Mucuna pruriens]